VLPASAPEKPANSRPTERRPQTANHTQKRHFSDLTNFARKT
jgi:hypothetical protein